MTKPVLIMQQCFGYCCTVLPVSKLSLFLTPSPPLPSKKKWGVNIAVTADSDWPKEYFAPASIKLSNKTGEVGEEKVDWDMESVFQWPLLGDWLVSDLLM